MSAMGRKLTSRGGEPLNANGDNRRCALFRWATPFRAIQNKVAANERRNPQPLACDQRPTNKGVKPQRRDRSHDEHGDDFAPPSDMSRSHAVNFSFAELNVNNASLAARLAVYRDYQRALFLEYDRCPIKRFIEPSVHTVLLPVIGQHRNLQVAKVLHSRIRR